MPTGEDLLEEFFSASLDAKSSYPVVQLVEVFPENPEKATNGTVKCTFEDGGTETATCQWPDDFSIEAGIAICVAKHAMGGSSNYNKAVNHGMKVYNKQVKDKIEREKEEQRIKKKYAKRAAYKAKRDRQRAEESAAIYMNERQTRIDEMKEAIIEAIEDVKRSNGGL